MTNPTPPTNPLPSLLRASAWDAIDARMREAGRSAWTRGDYKQAVRIQNRLVRACYGRKDDPVGSPAAFIRFGIAEQMERAGLFTISSDFREISRQIDAAMEAM